MGIYALRRTLQMIPLLIAISLVIFGLTALAPGDPVDQLIMGNPKITPEDIERLRESYGLNQPWYERYWSWANRAMQGDFGYSRDFSIPAIDFVFQQRVPNTLLLTIPALIISTLIAVPLGIYSAIRPYSVLDYILSFFSLIGFSAPSFWLGIMAMYVFAVWLPQITGGLISLPPGGLGSGITIEDGRGAFLLDQLKYLLLPMSIMMVREIAVTMRYMRASFLETINQDFVRTAKAKGLPNNVVLYKHALRNSLIPIITILGLAIPSLFGGSVIIEQVFSWPGMGKALFDSLVSKDFNVLMLCLMFLSILTVVFLLITDLVYALVDPRIQYS